MTSLSFLRDHDEDVTPQALDWMALTDRHQNVSRRLRAADDEVLLGDVWKGASLSPRTCRGKRFSEFSMKQCGGSKLVVRAAMEPWLARQS